MLMRFLGGYGDNFAVAVALWPAVSLLLTLPILAYLYHRDGRIRSSSFVAVYLAVLYALGLGCFTLYPLPSGDSGLGITYGAPVQLNPLGFAGDIAKDGFSAVLQILANVAFFVPLGLFGRRFFRWPARRTLLTGVAVSLLIEVAQLTGLFGIYPYSYRTFDVCDVAWNAAGAMLGWKLAALLARLVPERLEAAPEVTRSPGFVRRCVAFCLDMLAVEVCSAVLAAALSALLALAQAGGEGVSLLSVASAARAACFLALELAVPLAREGRTLGGGFVHMTCETRERSGLRRAVFYATRTAALGCAAFPVDALGGMLSLVPLACLAFYALARKMPYDLL